MVANNGTYGDSSGTVLSGQASIPVNMSELLNGTYLRLSWNREYHIGYGRKILDLDSRQHPIVTFIEFYSIVNSISQGA